MNPRDQVASIEGMIRDFWQSFVKRPGMLGSPEELSSIIFYIDQVEYLMLGGNPSEYWERSWMNFLVDRKLIVGGRSILKEELQKQAGDYALLQDLRREYLEWRSVDGRWPEA
ncbi:hypothetical protein [Lysobacter sp. Root559]|uniref:hypothetical protein n=1 Tax=Lysobacter sp. Root559 TaxID=1736559 RepID=UPI0012FBA70B|nr:hypothetical protein [Lysobacter sp. Root559]